MGGRGRIHGIKGGKWTDETWDDGNSEMEEAGLAEENKEVREE